jgi:hypothetical protein
VPTAPPSCACSARGLASRSRADECLLQVRAPGHRRVAVQAGEGGQHIHDLGELGLDQDHGIPRLQYGGGVHDVLGRRAPVQVAPCLAELFRQLADEPDDGIADVLGIVLQLSQIERNGGRPVCDGGGGFARDDPGFSLSQGQCHLGPDIGTDLRLVREDGLHGRCGEDIPVEDAVEDGGWHRGAAGIGDMYGHIKDTYKFVKPGARAAAP